MHHGANRQYIDKNYGGTVILFDRLFGTFEPEQDTVVFGLVDPASSFEPLSLNASYWVKAVAKANTYVKDNVLRWFYVVVWAGPGYDPVENKTMLPPQVDSNRSKFDPKLAADWPSFARLYSYLVPLLLSNVVLMRLMERNIGDLMWAWRIAVSVAIACAVAQIGVASNGAVGSAAAWRRNELARIAATILLLFAIDLKPVPKSVLIGVQLVFAVYVACLLQAQPVNDRMKKTK